MLRVVLALLLLLLCIYLSTYTGLNFYPVSTYPQLQIINNNATIIRKELNECNKWIDWPERDLTQNPGDWTVIPLYGFGKWSNCANFPETVKILKQIDGLRTAGFSKLNPKVRLKPHRGWAKLSNNVLRCHYGISVPINCTITCNGETRTQYENKWLIFDDSKTHSAHNGSHSDRIVLIIDIDRPKTIPRGTSSVINSPELDNFIKNM